MSRQCVPVILLVAGILTAGASPSESRAQSRDLGSEAPAAARGDAEEAVRQGQALFFLGEMEASVAEFDRAVSLDVSAEPYLWQRGIAQFYAGQFAACRRQFEIHRTVNPTDVENAAWHFLCVAAADGTETAREALLPVGRDSRVPLPEIYELFAGRVEEQAVLDEVGSVTSDRARRDAEFYARLYLGLYAEVQGNSAAARDHLEKAHALGFPHYMGEVARIHLERLKSPERTPAHD